MLPISTSLLPLLFSDTAVRGPLRHPSLHCHSLAPCHPQHVTWHRPSWASQKGLTEPSERATPLVILLGPRKGPHHLHSRRPLLSCHHPLQGRKQRGGQPTSLQQQRSPPSQTTCSGYQSNGRPLQTSSDLLQEKDWDTKIVQTGQKKCILCCISFFLQKQESCASCEQWWTHHQWLMSVVFIVAFAQQCA